MRLTQVLLLVLFAGDILAAANDGPAAPGGQPRQDDPAAGPGRIFCCDDANNKRLCGDFLPPACQSRAYEIRDNKGFVTARKEAPLTPEQQIRRQAELARKADEEKKALEERRRTQALLSTYASDLDIDRARDRELAETDKAMQQAQQRLDEANSKSKKLDKEKEFYKGKPLPAQLKGLIRDNEAQIKAQQAVVDAQLKEKDQIRVKYAAEKKRFLELTGKKPSAAIPEAATGGDKPAAPAPAAKK